MAFNLHSKMSLSLLSSMAISTYIQHMCEFLPALCVGEFRLKVIKWVFQLFSVFKNAVSYSSAVLYTIDEEMLCELSVKCVLMPAVAVRDRL